MMPTDNQIQRIAAMANQLRPDWPVLSLLTHLVNNHTHRSYRDLAVALAWVATDPASETPARLSQAGPWWDASSVTKQSSRPVVKAHRCVDHPTQPASHCQDCIDQTVPKPDWFSIPKPTKNPNDRDPIPLADLLPRPPTKCALCHDADTEPGRGICPNCAKSVSQQ